MVMGDQPDGSPHPGLALVPMSELTTKDTWRVAGMCATASNTLLADDLFVPDHRVHSFLDLTVEAYARTDDSEPTARASFAAAGTFIGAAPIMVGVAKAALDITLEQRGEQGGRLLVLRTGPGLADPPAGDRQGGHGGRPRAAAGEALRGDDRRACRARRAAHAAGPVAMQSRHREDRRARTHGDRTVAHQRRIELRQREPSPARLARCRGGRAPCPDPSRAGRPSARPRRSRHRGARPRPLRRRRAPRHLGLWSHPGAA